MIPQDGELVGSRSSIFQKNRLGFHTVGTEIFAYRIETMSGKGYRARPLEATRPHQVRTQIPPNPLNPRIAEMEL